MNITIVTTDGSCVQGQNLDAAGTLVEKRQRGPGGWAAIIKRSGQEWIVTGHEADTTNTRMELRAIIEGLRQVVAPTSVVLRTDITLADLAIHAWRSGRFYDVAGNATDRDLLLKMHVELERLGTVRSELVRRRDYNREHGLCHKAAKREAKALWLKVSGLPPAKHDHRLLPHLRHQEYGSTVPSPARPLLVRRDDLEPMRIPVPYRPPMV